MAGKFVEETTIAQYLFSLRRALNVSQGERQFIETVPKRGYRFVVKAQEGWDETGTLEFKRSRSVHPRVTGGELGEGKAAITSVAVLPLVNVSKDPKAEYLSNRLTELIINSLSGLPPLRVMACSVVSRYKDKDVDPQKLGREIGVQAVVVGTLLQIDNRFYYRSGTGRCGKRVATLGSAVRPGDFRHFLTGGRDLQSNIGKPAFAARRHRRQTPGKHRNASRS